LQRFEILAVMCEDRLHIDLGQIQIFAELREHLHEVRRFRLFCHDFLPMRLVATSPPVET
jgi:hypothetical protein